MAHLVLTVWRIISMQAADWSIISENYKKQTYYQNKKIKTLCFQQEQQKSNTKFQYMH